VRAVALGYVLGTEGMARREQGCSNGLLRPVSAPVLNNINTTFRRRIGQEKRTLVTQILIWFKGCRRRWRKIRYPASHGRIRYNRDDRRNGDRSRYVCTHIIARSWRRIAIRIMWGRRSRLGCIILWVVRWDGRFVDVRRRLVCMLREAWASRGWWSKLVRGREVGSP
jgi:hypothetical protein